MTFTQAKAAMDTLYNAGVRLLILEGGKPFLWRDGEHALKDIVSQAKRLFFSMGITTNGTSPSKARRISSRSASMASRIARTTIVVPPSIG
jgi:MoaA/NifB/PqqE/SkfB family radical SAM enzyme